MADPDQEGGGGGGGALSKKIVVGYGNWSKTPSYKGSLIQAVTVLQQTEEEAHKIV